MSWDDGESCGILAMMCFLWYGYMKNIAQFYLEVVEDPFLFGLSVCMPRGRTVNRVESSRVESIIKHLLTRGIMMSRVNVVFATWKNLPPTICLCGGLDYR